MTLRNGLLSLVLVTMMVGCGDDDRAPPPPGVDAQFPDTGPIPDTGPSDAGPPDGDTMDAPLDASLDAAPMDAMPSDGSATDAPMIDAGPPPLPKDQLAGGLEHTCAIQGPAVWCWGQNMDGQLGDGTSTDRDRPVIITRGVPILVPFAVALGARHSCAAHDRGRIACWGNNEEGQLGNGLFTRSLVPVAVSAIGDAIDLCAGGNHTCALRASGAVVCWGSDANGQLGDGTADVGTPVPRTAVTGIDDATDITCGNTHTCALLGDGVVTCWGNNTDGQLGNATIRAINPDPTSVTLADDAVDLAAGANHTCVLLRSGHVQCFGRNDRGQLAIEPTTASSSMPREVLGVMDASEIAAGEQHSCILYSAGRYSCWGSNMYGQLGDGTVTDRFLAFPPAMSLFTDGVFITAGGQHSCAIREGNTVYCWGWNSTGQLGIDSMIDQPRPTGVSFVP